MSHNCTIPHCDGTRLGHDLARDFPVETARFETAMDDLRGSPEDRVRPENLQVDEPPAELRCVFRPCAECSTEVLVVLGQDGPKICKDHS